MDHTITDSILRFSLSRCLLGHLKFLSLLLVPDKVVLQRSQKYEFQGHGVEVEDKVRQVIPESLLLSSKINEKKARWFSWKWCQNEAECDL